MFSFDPLQLELRQLHGLMIGAIAPRPIALVSTQSIDGKDNLAPFSFFNVFSSNPPVVAFSAAKRGRDGSFKDTYLNLMETQECVVHVVNFNMVEQINVASIEYPFGIDEFIKSGLTKTPSTLVKPFRVQESPFHMECKLRQMIALGDKNASGQLAICDVVQIHISKEMYQDGKVNFTQMDQVGRNGGAFYTRAYGDALFEVPQPVQTLGVGYDQLPLLFRSSHQLSANDLGQMSLLTLLPSLDECNQFVKTLNQDKLFDQAKEFLKQRKTLEAYKILMTIL